MRFNRLCLAGLKLGLASSASCLAVANANAQATPPQPAPSSAQTMPQPPASTLPGSDAPTSTGPEAASSESAPAEAGGPDITVTGSRLALRGYQQPTPVTVVGTEKLERDSKTDLSSVLVEIPAVGPSQSTNSGLGTQSISASTAGLALINLRNLGVPRTLTLFDGLRVAQSAEGGGVDLNLLPSTLVQRIDIVTGGASAAWGSDAVSGVINVILNKRFSGVAANFEGGSTENGVRQQAKGEISFGRDLGSHAHVILSASYLYSPDRVLPNQLSWYRSQNLVNNPAYTTANGQPRLIHAVNVGMANATQGGLITSGPLRGTQFLENGTPAPFDFGNVSGTLSNGGTFANPIFQGQAQNLTVPVRATQLFGNLSYDFGGGIVASIELNYGKSVTNNSGPSYTRNNNLPIRIDNPYLDQSIVTRMQQAGITSFNLSTTNTNNAIIARGDDSSALGVGNWNTDVNRELFRQVLSIEGPIKLFTDWKWNADFQHSLVHRNTVINGNPITARYNLATDAVRVTAANVGTSGLAIGSIACRSTLAAPTNGCVPLNVLGIGVASPAAIAYVQGRNDGSGSVSDISFGQYTASGGLRGQPFSTWAGPVAVALGVDYRKDTLRQTADPLQYARAYTISNRQPIDVSQNSIEGFGEINIPLIANGVVKSLDLNGAARYTSYSTSGDVVTWKVGLVSQLTDDIRIRGTVSRDIRQPTLIDLFDPGNSQQQVVSDPQNGNASVSIVTLVAGNPNLKPEIARTYTAGVVLTPRFMRGFNLSVDYYSIKITNALTTPIADQVLQGCAANNQQFCALVQRNAAGVLTGLLVGPVNAASQTTSGIDFQADYRVPALGGRIDLSAVGNYVINLRTDALGAVREPLNSLNRTFEGPNKFRATVSATYSQDRFSATAQSRIIGAASLNRFFTPTDVDDNHVPAVAYVDLRGSYYLTSDKKVQAYVAVDNLLDRDPPIIPNEPTAAFAYFFVPTRTELYDFLGRSYRVGVRVKF